MQSASVICANCVISFSAHIEMVYDAVIEGSLGDTVH